MKISRFLFFLVSCFLISCTGKESKQPDDTISVQPDTSAVQHKDTEINTGDTLVFLWDGDMCRYRGYYPASRYTREELENTLEVWKRLWTGLSAGTSVFSPADIDKIDTSELTAEYEGLVAFIDNAGVVDVRFWKDLLVREKKNLKKQYDLKIMRSKAYSDPSVLLDNPYLGSDSECYKYARALNASDDELYKAWEALANEAKKNNGDPDGFMQRFYDKYNSQNKKQYAYIDMIGFGWWNCVNRAVIDYPDYQLLSDNFNKLFVRVEEYDCEEP